ncbi:hypothetical protein V492_08169 [Pseudogymnoascus sp. VKM F-4246]|nr:hypothetical protein V492_08169 [Pseudogymnoascus sp. VKM F-4246]
MRRRPARRPQPAAHRRVRDAAARERASAVGVQQAAARAAPCCGEVAGEERAEDGVEATSTSCAYRGDCAEAAAEEADDAGDGA